MAHLIAVLLWPVEPQSARCGRALALCAVWTTGHTLPTSDRVWSLPGPALVPSSVGPGAGVALVVGPCVGAGVGLGVASATAQDAARLFASAVGHSLDLLRRGTHHAGLRAALLPRLLLRLRSGPAALCHGAELAVGPCELTSAPIVSMPAGGSFSTEELVGLHPEHGADAGALQMRASLGRARQTM